MNFAQATELADKTMKLLEGLTTGQKRIVLSTIHARMNLEQEIEYENNRPNQQVGYGTAGEVMRDTPVPRHS